VIDDNTELSREQMAIVLGIGHGLLEIESLEGR